MKAKLLPKMLQVLAMLMLAGLAAADDAGVDGVLTVDLPPEEAHDLVEALHERGLDPIFLLAPTTTSERTTRICAVASGFIYYVSLKGVTGSKALDVGAVGEKLAAIRVATDLPIGVGFGIRDAESAARVATVSDAVVVGSALVSKMEELAEDPDRISAELASLVSDMRRAIDVATSQ